MGVLWEFTRLPRESSVYNEISRSPGGVQIIVDAKSYLTTPEWGDDRDFDEYVEAHHDLDGDAVVIYRELVKQAGDEETMGKEFGRILAEREHRSGVLLERIPKVYRPG